jgi:predicted transcriptional regulator
VHKANLPYDRFRSYLSDLDHLDLVSVEEVGAVVTGKGLEYAQEYKRIDTFLKDMGTPQ